MSDLEKKEVGAVAETLEEEGAGAVPVRRGKRRNCMYVAGSENPIVAKQFSLALMKEVLGMEEAAPSNPEDLENEE
jgi:hypothetical protein